MQPEVPFSTTNFKNLKWFGQELTELWNEKANDKGRILIFLAIDPKSQGDLQGPMIFYMTPKLNGLSRSLWPICDSIQRIMGEIRNWKHNDVMFPRPEVTLENSE